MSWIDPVIDRTAADAAAKNLKGQLRPDDLNRIEGDVEYISQQVCLYGYYAPVSVKIDWTIEDYPTKAALDRIRANITCIREAYAVLEGTPDIDFTHTLDWDDMNDIETNLLNQKILLERMIEGFRYCGGFNYYSGSEVVLP